MLASTTMSFTMAPSWSQILSTSQFTFPENPTTKLPIRFPYERWPFHFPIRTSRGLCLAALSCRGTSADAAVEALTLQDICGGKVPQHILKRAEEVGYVMPTDIQRQFLPVLLSGKDCVLHAQTGSGKTLAYLLLIFSAINFQRSAVQALVIVPTRELGMQVTKVARILAAKSTGAHHIQKSCTIMALLDGGMLKRHKSWLKAEPPEVVIATIASLTQMIERHVLKLDSVRVLVVDEVDFIFNSSKQAHALRKLLTAHLTIKCRQTVFASASIPQHHRFLYDCVQHKWTKNDVVHIHANSVEPMPSNLYHNFLICRKEERLSSLLYLLRRDVPRSSIIFVAEQGDLEIALLEEDVNFNARATLLSDIRETGFLLVATDLASRGFDLPQTTHIYNFHLPRTAVDYLHRAGRTARLPFSTQRFSVTSLIQPEERFVLQRFENELMFRCIEVVL
ncbi:hypothetical protein HPP92_010110 [Vanilla planifolia]|uniref:RNA helicase n=1 Tax=Vanilla planifolia TaxID=51239 RepID=A0A835R304_VANPL|nr:hypothetical protein HPP92_010110 [Vanilla planifolia]